MKWAFDFVGPIKPRKRYIGNKYIFITRNYVTKWVEARALKINICNNHNKFFVWMHINQVWMSFDYSHKVGSSFH